MSVVLKKGSSSITIPPEEVEKVKHCSKFIESNLEFSDQDGEDKTFEIETSDFEFEHLKDAFDYLRALKFEPIVYRRIMSNDLNSELFTEEEKSLAKKYTTVGTIKKLHSVGKYLQIKSLVSYALVLLGVQIKVNENQHNSLDEIRARWHITTEYDMNVERELKKKYEFLKGAQDGN
jgi:hypothetical protein